MCRQGDTTVERSASLRNRFMTSIFELPLELSRRYWLCASIKDASKGDNGFRRRILEWRVSSERFESFKALVVGNDQADEDRVAARMVQDLNTA